MSAASPTPPRGAQPFVFIPSADAAAAYGGTLAFWTLDDERSYFQNLIARSSQQAYASLTLTLKTTTVTSDSVISAYDYVLVFEHNETGFPRTARGKPAVHLPRGRQQLLGDPALGGLQDHEGRDVERFQGKVQQLNAFLPPGRKAPDGEVMCLRIGALARGPVSCRE